MKELDYLEELVRHLEWYESFLIGTYGEYTEVLKTTMACKESVQYDIKVIKESTPSLE